MSVSRIKTEPLFSADFFKMKLPTEKFGVGGEAAENEPKPEETLRTKLKRIALHLALAAAVVLYIVSGALLFQWIEQPSGDADDAHTGVKELLDQIRSHIPDNVTAEIEDKLRDVLADLRDLQMDLLESIDDDDGLNATRRDSYLANHDIYSWQSFPSAVLFAFTTVSTIGYGHIYPVTTAGRLLCIVYTLCGIPLFMISVADVGKFLWETVRFVFKGRVQGDSVGELPLSYSVPFLVCLFVGYMMLGALLIPLFERITFVQALYMNFISMTTVGFGDVIPKHPYFLPVTMLYIFFGLSLTTLAIEVLATGMRRFHYLGYGIKGARLASVWVGGKLMSVDVLMRSMAREMGVSEEEMDAMGDNLDQLLERAAAEYEETGHIRMPTPPPDAVRRRQARKSSLAANGHLVNGDDPMRWSGQYDNHPDNVWEARFGKVEYADAKEDLDVNWLLFYPADNA